MFITPKLDDEKIKEAMTHLSNTFGRHLILKKNLINQFDIVENSTMIAKIIDNESILGNEVIIHITEHSEYSFCLSYGAYSRFQKIKRIISISRKGTVVDLPVLKYQLTENKIKLLQQLDQPQQQTMESLSKKLGLSEGMVYHHIRELRNRNLIKKEKLEITTAGQLAII
jgi:CRISPR-associated protein Csa3